MTARDYEAERMRVRLREVREALIEALATHRGSIESIGLPGPSKGGEVVDWASGAAMRLVRISEMAAEMDCLHRAAVRAERLRNAAT